MSRTTRKVSPTYHQWRNKRRQRVTNDEISVASQWTYRQPMAYEKQRAETTNSLAEFSFTWFLNHFHWFWMDFGGVKEHDFIAFFICCRSSNFGELSVLLRENLLFSCFQCIIFHDVLTFSTSEFQCSLGEGTWSIFDQVLGWVFEALGGQEKQKGNKMIHNGGDGNVLMAKTVLARKMEC